MTKAPALIAIDWGSTSFRAALLAGDGAVLSARQAARGITAVADRQFAAALRGEIGDWLAAGLPLVLSGMITSRNGWIETAYVRTPADGTAIAAGVRRETIEGLALHFVPGVAQDSPGDVMRGEETQILGTDLQDGLVVLPGTHSKWVRLAGSRIESFATFLTGEMFGLLRRHSLVGALAEGDEPDDEAFADGVRRGVAATREGPGLLGLVFAARAEVLLASLPARAASAWLSGALIGAELAGGERLGRSGALTVIGSPDLTARYLKAAELIELPARAGPDDAALRGLARLGRELGFLQAGPSAPGAAHVA